MNKKLQVFVSSTYTDLKEERQAAVQAILDAGHIPAGMELFKAGNESQLKTIYKWIDESDVYMLILGGRYGSVESKSGKSYTQLEYEYALSKDIPVFAVVLSQAFLTQKINSLTLEKTMEQDYPDRHKSFKTLVMSKIIREVDDCKDIKIAIHTTLNEFIHDYNLTGWIRNNNENDTHQLLKDNANLLKENNSLNKQIQRLQEKLNAKAREQFGNYSFDELVIVLKNKIFEIPAKFTGNQKGGTINALKFFIKYFDFFVVGVENTNNSSAFEAHIFYNIAPYYISFDFMERVKLPNTTAQRIHTTKLGSAFYAMLETKNMTKE
ncbi:MAG: DUF4062 domain-containing protein [Lachnospiraceae bacterium]|nr:DUF4062 domain-containing protein [Lachnospiraceae bacterium]